MEVLNSIFISHIVENTSSLISVCTVTEKAAKVNIHV